MGDKGRSSPTEWLLNPCADGSGKAARGQALAAAGRRDGGRWGAPYRRPLRIGSFIFCRRDTRSGSAKAVSRVPTLFVLLHVLLMALSNWA